MNLSALDINTALASLCLLSLLVSVLSGLCALSVARTSSKEQRRLNREMFGLVKKLEGLTSHKRQQVLQQFDTLVENLSNRIPTLVAAKASEKIFETESSILTQLAEIEPSLADEGQKEKLDSLIRSMEALESTVVAHTAKAVHQVMLENRKTIFSEEHASVVHFSK